jgi:hypothetical protein
VRPLSLSLSHQLELPARGLRPRKHAIELRRRHIERAGQRRLENCAGIDRGPQVAPFEERPLVETGPVGDDLRARDGRA